MNRLLIIVLVLCSACASDFPDFKSIDFIVDNQSNDRIAVITPSISDADTSWVSPNTQLTIYMANLATNDKVEEVVSDQIGYFLYNTIIFNTNQETLKKEVSQPENWTVRELKKTVFTFVTFTVRDDDF